MCVGGGGGGVTVTLRLDQGGVVEVIKNSFKQHLEIGGKDKNCLQGVQRVSKPLPPPNRILIVLAKTSRLQFFMLNAAKL